ncbi:MAG: peptidoglycan-binding domain-containing protein [Pseudomonadota bacterium]
MRRMLRTGSIIAAVSIMLAASGKAAEADDVNPWLGGAGGAVAGGILGRLIAGKHHNTAAMLGGAALGGLGGAVASNAYNQKQQNEQTNAFEAQQAQHNAAIDSQLRQQANVNQWSDHSNAAPAAASGYTGINTAAEITEAQRLLTALGIYTDKIDGLMGPNTRAAVIRFQADENMSQTGDVTPQLITKMKQTLGG